MTQDSQQQVYSKILHYLQSQQYQKAEQMCLFEIGNKAEPDDRLYFYLGTAARFMNKNKAAIVAFEAALNLKPGNLDYIQGCASAYEADQNYEKTYQLTSEALALAPQNASVRANYAVALERVNKPEEALQQYQSVLAIDDKNITANINLGSLLHKLYRKRSALAHNRQAHIKFPQVFGTLYNLVDTLITNFCYEEALEYCDKGLALQPRHAHLMVKKAMILSALSRPEEALGYLSQARIINPNVLKDLLPHVRSLSPDISIYLDGYILQYEARYDEQRACYWKFRKKYLEQLRSDLEVNGAANYALRGKENGFKLLSLDIGAEQRKKLMGQIADAVSDFSWLTATQPFQYLSNHAGKLRIGYLSPDFRTHPTAVLSRQIYGLHDRGLFRVYGYALYNVVEHDSYLQEIQASCDEFFDISAMSSAEAAKKINDDKIDILIDMAGYTAYCRTEIMALKPAPIQMQYLGFSSTMGADFIDYALIDKQLCPDDKSDEWHEQPIRLPHTLYPYDNEINCSPTLLRRTDFGLPEDQFVFCCFNNSYKIEPLIFERWMNLLKAVPNSVLWLLGKDTDVQENLEREADACGVDQSRLIFAGRLPMEQHLPRYQLADLFLDTYWHNAHTTGAEALWQGLPLITIKGEVPSARGAASILTALEMPELIVPNFDEYEQLAIFYATHPTEYGAMRERLKAQRYNAPMYNTKLTVKHLERAYQIAWERYQVGLPAAAFDVPEITDPELRKSIH